MALSQNSLDNGNCPVGLPLLFTDGCQLALRFEACPAEAMFSRGQCLRAGENDVVDGECSTATPSESDDEVQSHSELTFKGERRFPWDNAALATFRPPPGLTHPSMELYTSEERPYITSTGHEMHMGASTLGNTLSLQQAIFAQETRGLDASAQAISAERSVQQEDNARQLGVLGVPSAGSAGHFLGICKPCDFVNRGSCRRGVDCQFCHLCGTQDNKVRKKQRKQLLNAAKSFQRGVASRQVVSSAGTRMQF